MLIPQFSIRTLMLLTAAAAVVSLVFAMAVRGQDWAIAASAGVLALAGTFLVFACTFLVVWSLGRLFAAFFPAPPRDDAGGGP